MTLKLFNINYLSVVYQADFGAKAAPCPDTPHCPASTKWSGRPSALHEARHGILSALMRTSYLALGVGAFLAMAILADWYSRPDGEPLAPPSGPIPLACDRTCLEDLVDEYLDALAVNAPALLPLSEDVRFTENGQVLEVGDGFWKTASDRGQDGHYVSDPVAGQVAFMGTMEESGQREVWLSLRLRVELGRVTEIETTTWRPALGGPPPVAGAVALEATGTPEGPDPAWAALIPPAERLSRQEMIALANAWFDSASGESEYDPFALECVRTVNGEAPLACQSWRDADAGITAVHGRRFPVLDEERGVAWAYAVVDRDGTGLETPQAPASAQFSGAFLIGGARIVRMETLEIPMPFHANSPWPGGLTGR